LINADPTLLATLLSLYPLFDLEPLETPMPANPERRYLFAAGKLVERRSRYLEIPTDILCS